MYLPQYLKTALENEVSVTDINEELQTAPQEKEKEPMIKIVGPLSDAYTKALNIELAKNNPVDSAIELAVESLNPEEQSVIETIETTVDPITDPNNDVIVYVNLDGNTMNDETLDSVKSEIESATTLGPVIALIKGDDTIVENKTIVDPLASLESLLQDHGGKLYRSVESFKANFKDDISSMVVRKKQNG